MTIGRKLYYGFGAILAIILFLFVINIFTVIRQYSARSAVAATLADVQTIEGVRYKMIANRLSLGNYLLSGDLPIGGTVAAGRGALHGDGWVQPVDAIKRLELSKSNYVDAIALDKLVRDFHDASPLPPTKKAKADR